MKKRHLTLGYGFMMIKEAQIRILANADSYGNLKAKSYLRLALHEPIIPEFVFEVKPITNNSESLLLNSEEINSVFIYPNPTLDNRFKIMLPNFIEKSEIQVINNLGQVVYINNAYQSGFEIELPEEKPGIYFISINYLLDGGLVTETKKLMVTND